MANHPNLRLCSFNCRSVKNCIPEIVKLCNSHDVVLIQEHWLLPDELVLLNNLHDDFHSHALSAVDLSKEVLIGRPFGGTAILYRKCYVDKVHVCRTDISRITAITVDSAEGPLLFINVYMPTNYGDDDSLESYLDCLSKLNALIIDTSSSHIIIAGDFNCSFNSRFFSEFSDFALENNLVISDMSRLSNVTTYVSDDCTKATWIDHVLSSFDADKLIISIHVLDDVIVSDHRPLSFSLNCEVIKCLAPSPVPNRETRSPIWSQCDTSTLDYYAYYLDSLLQSVAVPYHIFNEAAHSHTSRTAAIDKYYCELLSCINKATNVCIPLRTPNKPDYNVPGWNTYVAEKHETARNAYLLWRNCGKPRSGFCFENMKTSRAQFKLALRYCKANVEEMKANACAESLFDTDPKKFWNSVHKTSNSKANVHVVSVGGVSGSSNVADMWKDHFEKLYNAQPNNKYRLLFEQKLMNKLSVTSEPVISVCDVSDSVSRQKRNKAPGPDGIRMEAFIFAGHRLRVLLSILFDMFIKCSYVPSAFCESTIVPLVKCKTGDLTDVNNYRAIALSNAISKILEHILYDFIANEDDVDDFQFGFKKGHSTSDCTFVLKNTIDYYRCNGSHVFACFIDFSKAFDNVNYWLLFYKLLDSCASVAGSLTVRLLAFWYSNQLMCVNWQGISSSCFKISNGVRQGGILSPFLFRYYIRDLIRQVTSSKIGCHLYNMCSNLLAYADDIVLLAPSWHGLQQLLNIISAAAIEADLCFNTKKTVTMIFNPHNPHKRLHSVFPSFSLSGCQLSFVTNFKYLGHIIEHTLHDDSDISRELRCLFTRTNVLIRRFWRCSLDVKLRLFRTYCMCFYDMSLWKYYKVGSMNKLAAAYIRKCIKIFFGKIQQ